MPLFADPSLIRNVRFHEIRYDESGEPRGTVAFEYGERECVITEPRDVLLSDDDPSREWIERRYGFLLGIVGPSAGESLDES